MISVAGLFKIIDKQMMQSLENQDKTRSASNSSITVSVVRDMSDNVDKTASAP
jgi:phosphoribulokinase